jgi:hypothetical protein
MGALEKISIIEQKDYKLGQSGHKDFTWSVDDRMLNPQNKTPGIDPGVGLRVPGFATRAYGVEPGPPDQSGRYLTG